MPVGRHERFEWYLKVGGWTGRGTVPHPVNQKRRRRPYAAPEVRRGAASPMIRALLLSEDDSTLHSGERKEEQVKRERKRSKEVCIFRSVKIFLERFSDLDLNWSWTGAL